MHPDKVERARTKSLTDLPNIGPKLAGSLRSIGIHSPQQLEGQDPVMLYGMLCERTGEKIDPCVLDVFMSVVDFMNGNETKVWWAYTAERKRLTPLPKS